MKPRNKRTKEPTVVAKIRPEKLWLSFVMAVVTLCMFLPQTSIADRSIDVHLPDRLDCRTTFGQHWDKGFQVAKRKRAIYEERIRDLHKEIDNLRNQPVWDVPILRDIARGSLAAKSWSDALLGVKAATGLLQTALGSLAEAAGQSWAVTAIEAGSMQAEWVALQLRDGNTTIHGIISSSATSDYAAFAGKKIVASIDPIAAVNIQIIDSLAEGFEQDVEFRSYVGELKNQVKMLEHDIKRTRSLLKNEEIRIRDVVERGSTAFCKNEPPVANDDEARAEGRNFVDVPVLSNDKDPEDLGLRLVSIQRTNGGRAIIQKNGTPGIYSDDFIRFAASDGFSGKATITYVIVDDLGLQSAGTVTIHVSKIQPKVSYTPESSACKITGTC